MAIRRKNAILPEGFSCRMNASKRCLLAALPLLILAGMVQGQTPAPIAATTPPPASAGSLSDLKQHPTNWPRQLTLKADVKLMIMSQGREVGSIVSPAGATVDLISVDDTAIQIGVGSARASVAPEQTDLWARVGPPQAASVTTVFPTNAAAAPASSAPPVATAPAGPPIATPPAGPQPMTPPPGRPAAGDGGAVLAFDEEIPPRDNFTKAAFRFWSPTYAQPIRGVLILVPGLNGDGRGMLQNPLWQNLARKYRLAIVSSFMRGTDYHNALKGTGAALLEALKKFAGESGHPEIAHAPLVMYGESAGGQYDYSFALMNPEMVIAFVVNKGGVYSHDEPDSRMRGDPGLFFLGQSDTAERIKAITDIWTAGRLRGALWALAPQPDSGHEFSKTAAVAAVFFDAVLAARLPDDNPLAGDPAPLKPMQETQGWTGDLATHDVHDASTDAQPDRHAAWLPDQASAQAWKAFVSGS